MATDPSEKASSDLEEQVGSPVLLWESLKDRVQSDAVRTFADVQGEWLALMWSLDAYRSRSVTPRGVPAKTLGALNRSKGIRFAELLSLLLQNRTTQHVGTRAEVRGFSQSHRLGLVWPVRISDPLICADTKVSGAPAFGATPARGAMDDWPQRRKEVKFVATDLKLFRGQSQTSIDRWERWRHSAPPRLFFIWAARLRTEDANDAVEDLVREVEALTKTYIDSAALLAWRTRPDGTGYEVPPVVSTTVRSVDQVLAEFADGVNELLNNAGRPPPPQAPTALTLAEGQLFGDGVDHAE